MSNNPYLANVQADNEDLIVQNNLLKFKDRAYDTTAFSGLGRCILRKNIDGNRNKLTSAMLNKENTVYEIRYDFDLNGTPIQIPKGCVLDFQGGSIKNGTIDFNKCYVKAEPHYCIFPNVKVVGYVLNEAIYSAWFEQGGNLTDSNDVQQALNLTIRHDIIGSSDDFITGYRKDRTKKTVFLTPDKNYFISESLCLYPGVSIDGQYARLAPARTADQQGFKDWLIKQDIKEGAYIIEFPGAFSEIRNLHFDNSKDYIGNPSTYAKGILFAGRVKISNIDFHNFNEEIASFEDQYIDGITIDTIGIMEHPGDKPVIKIYQGDRTRIHGINGPHNINIKLHQCHGGEVANSIGVGVIATRCNALTISNMHIERGHGSEQARFEFDGTVATIKDSIIYERNLWEQFAINVLTDTVGQTASVITLQNVGIMRNDDSDHNVNYLNDIACDARSTIIFDMCYVNYQSMGSIHGFTGFFLAPTIYDNTNKVYLDIDRINTLDGVYSGGKFSEFTRELNIASQAMLQDISQNTDKKYKDKDGNFIGGVFPKIGTYEYYVIPLVSGSRHIGYSKGSLKKSHQLIDTKHVLNITFNLWEVNQNYLNNVIRICRCNKATGKTQYVELIALGKFTYSLVDMGDRIRNLGQWKDYVDPIIMEGSTCTIKDKNVKEGAGNKENNIIAYLTNIKSGSQLQTRSFRNGDIIESEKCTFYFNNGRWETRILSSDSISGDLSGWVNFFSLKKGPSVWERKSVLIAISSSYNGGSSSTAIINLPYGGTSAPYIVSSGKNYSSQIRFSYVYDTDYLRLYIDAGGNRCHSVKVLQCDVASSLYDVTAKAVTLPGNATVFATI